MTEGFLLGGYAFSDYKSASTSDVPGEVVVLSDAARDKAAVQALETAQVVAAAVARTRDWVNMPPADLTPGAFADAVSAAAKRHKVTVTVMDEKQLSEGGFGGIIGVGQGSANPPRLVKISLQAARARRRTSAWSARASPTTPAASPSSPARRCRR